MVLELGAGTGLTAIVASWFGISYIATDQHCITSLTRFNANCNQRKIITSGDTVPPGSIRIDELEWSESAAASFVLPTSQSVRYIVAADVVYARDVFSVLFDTLRVLCTRTQAPALIVYPKVRLRLVKEFVAM